MVNLPSWTTSAGGNNRTPPDGAPEGMVRSMVNNQAREAMAVTRRWYDDPEWLELTRDINGDEIVPVKLSANVLRIAGGTIDFTQYFNANRTVRITVGATDITALVVSSTYSNPNTDVTLTGYSGGLTEIPAATPLRLYEYISASFASIGGGGLGFYLPNANTAAGIQFAIDAANAAGGGVVLLNQGAYAIEATINLKPGVYVWGPEQGAAVLTLAAGVNAEMWNVNAGAFMGIRGIRMDCNRANQTAGDGIVIADGVGDLKLEEFFITGAFRDGITHSASATSADLVWVNGCRVLDCGRHGIAFFDTQSDLDNIFVTDNAVEGIGQSINDSAGILAAGSVVTKGNSISNLNEASPSTPRGIWLYQIAAAEPNPQSAFRGTCTGNVITGSAALAIGIQVGGRYCAVNSNVVDLPGISSKGIWVHSAPVAAEVPIGNVIADNVIVRATTGIHTEYTVSGRNSIHGNLMAVMNATGGRGLNLAGIDDEVYGNTIHSWDTTLESILVSGTDNWVHHNYAPGALTNGVHVTGTTNRVEYNRFPNITTTVLYGGTGNYVFFNTPKQDSISAYGVTTASQLGVLLQFANIAFPVAPDGVRLFRVRLELNYGQAAGVHVSLDFEFGPGGVGTSFLQATRKVNGKVSFDFTCQPQTSDTWGTRCQGDGVNNQQQLGGALLVGGGANTRASWYHIELVDTDTP